MSLQQTAAHDAEIVHAAAPAAAPETSDKGMTPRKQPPPESPSDIRRRTHVILSFWLIILFLGLPIWWWTTTIYRARLPLQEMLEWADGKVCWNTPPHPHLRQRMLF
jgi:phosphatidylinositol glycan class S